MAIMTIQRLHDLIDMNADKDALAWAGPCHDCKTETQVSATPLEDGIHIEGGSVYEPVANKFMIKCDDCFKKDPVLRDYQDCEVYSRVVGYLRPVAQWNDAKQMEFKDRRMFDSSIENNYS
jgi:hypothetical protein